MWQLDNVRGGRRAAPTLVPDRPVVTRLDINVEANKSRYLPNRLRVVKSQ
jgi:hypothetical protein